MKDRFAKLSALTRGAALLTLSAGVGAGTMAASAVTIGCSKNEAPTPPPASAAAIQPDPTPAPSPVATDATDSGPSALGRRKFPMPNAMHPGYGWNSPRGDAGPSDGGANDAP